jgi:NAD-dependent deacetylase
VAKIIILSGAGISAESGISTFRDSDGLWEQYNIKDICTAGCLETNRAQTIEFYDKRRADLEDKVPNYAHKKIKELKDKYPNDIQVITQNVDDLFEKAGCVDVIHLHGFLTKIRCEECNYSENIGYVPQIKAWENCPMCKSHLRPDIVFFGEVAPYYEDLFLEMDSCKMLVVIGTSGNVINTDMFLTTKWSKSTIEYSILNNLEKSDAINDKLYNKVLYKKATEAIDEIVLEIENFLNMQVS